MTKPVDLTDYLFEGLLKQKFDAALAAELTQWMDANPRFTDFVETYRDKIRKKIRVNREAESMQDLRAELEVAYKLLTDRRLAVTYEPYASAKQRGPDFGVAYRVNQVFNIEVARIRLEESDAGPWDLARPAERKVERILLNKLGQMQPGMANLLVIHAHAELARTVDLVRLMQALKTRVEGKDPAFYAAARYSGPADFYKAFLRLSGILFWTAGGELWVNKQAKSVIDEKVLRLIWSLATGGGAG